MDCEVCKGHGDVLGAACAVCAGGTGRAYDGVYMSWGGGGAIYGPRVPLP